MKQDIEVASRIEREKVTQELHEFAVPLFKAGAEWRINSVWHDAKEVIIKSGYILVEFKTKRSVSYNIWKIERADVVSYWNVFMAENKIIRYAYIDNLLP